MTDSIAHQIPQWTDQQAAAITMRKLSVALSAGAGCGKTFVLTQRFLSHLEPGPDAANLHQLVAITFTDKAAREMRERIRDECRWRLQQCPPAEVQHWLNIVRDLETARISTIHSFCSSLLRRHAVEAEIDPGFSLLEEASSRSLLHTTVREALLEQLEQRNPDAEELVWQQGLENAQVILEQFVPLRFRIDFSHWGAVSEEEVVQAWSSAAEKIAVENLMALRQSEPARQVLRLLTEFPPQDNKWVTPRREILLQLLPENSDCQNPLQTIEAIRFNSTLNNASRSKVWADPSIQQEVDAAFKLLRKEIGQLPKISPADDDEIRQAVRCGLVALRVAEHAVSAYEQRKQEAGLLDFDDLLLRTRNLLRDFPQVRRSATAGIAMLMVDEFQDTDPVQAQIVEFLCGEQLVDGKLFLVGDAKQSIYRFRRANPKVFAALREKISPKAQLPLSVNFRSQPAILNFVNALFAGEMGDAYERLIPHVKQLSPQPCIEFLWAYGETDEETGEAIKNIAADRRRREAIYIARRVYQLLHDKTPRIRQKNAESGEIELRPVKLGDVVILFRAMTDVRYYEQALRDYGLDYYLVGGRAFYAQQEIYDLVNLCQYLNDRDDDISLAGVLRSPFFSLRDETLFAIMQDAPNLSAAIVAAPPTTIDEQQQEQVRHAARVLAELRHNKDRLPLHQLLNLALALTGYDAALLAEHLGRRKLANLRKLIDMARQFQRTGLFTIAEFVQRLQDALSEEAKEELAATHPETSDVIRLMTIHQSKGLEFPVVVVADLDREDIPRASQVAFEEELGPLVSVPKKFGKKIPHLGREIHKSHEEEAENAETIRKLYVATTRAADHLILSSSFDEPGKTKSQWMRLLQECFDLETGKPAVDDETGAFCIAEDYVKAVPQVEVIAVEPTLANFRKQSEDGLLPLQQLRDTVANAAVEPLPQLLAKLDPDPRLRRQFSVSELEQVDAALRSQDVPASDRLREIMVDESENSPMDFEAVTVLGTLVHNVLERIDLHNTGDVDALVDICSSGLRSKATDEMRARAEEMVGSFLNSPLAEELRTAQREYRELEFLLHCPCTADEGPLRYIAGFIDCVFQSAEGTWHVIDYKTGRLSQHGSEAEQLAVYELQMGTYALAIRQLLGRLPDSVELVLVAEGCRRLALPVTEAFLQDVESRLAAAIKVVIADGTHRLP